MTTTRTTLYTLIDHDARGENDILKLESTQDYFTKKQLLRLQTTMLAVKTIVN